MCSVRFQVLTAASMKIRAFWNIAPCSLVGVDRCFTVITIALVMEAVRTSEPTVYYNVTTRRNILEQWYSTGGTPTPGDTRRHPKILFFVV
jgi:hypothetical protein